MESIKILSMVEFNKVKLNEKYSAINPTDNDTLSAILKGLISVEIKSKTFALQTQQVLRSGSISELLSYTTTACKKLDEIKTLKEHIIIDLNYLNTKYESQFNFYYISRGLNTVIELWNNTIESIVESRTSRFESEC